MHVFDARPESGIMKDESRFRIPSPAPMNSKLISEYGLHESALAPSDAGSVCPGRGWFSCKPGHEHEYGIHSGYIDIGSIKAPDKVHLVAVI